MLGRYRDAIRAWSDPVGRALFRLHLRPNHLTLMGLGVSLLAASAFISGRTRWAGGLLILAGLFDLFDGSLARVSGQVTPFGAFFDSVIDRYSDLVVLLGIVLLFARMPHARGALVAIAALVGSVMVSYTKARAESIGVTCDVGVMERPERMLCLIAGALFDLLEPALWVLAILANLTALQRIAFTRRMARATPIRRAVLVAGLLLGAGPVASAAPPAGAVAVGPETERAWTQAVAEYQQGSRAAVVREFAAEAALESPIADYLRYILADALARGGDLAGARATATALVDRHPDSRLAPAALVLAATLASRSGDEATAQALLKRLIDSYPDAAELPEALYLLAMTGEARGQTDAAAHAYRRLVILAPTTGYADGAGDRLAALAAAGVQLPPLTMTQRIDRAERLLRGGVPGTAGDEAERIVKEAREPGITLRALRVIADGAQRLGRYEAAARALELAAQRAPAEQKPRLQLDQGRLLVRAGQRDRALALFNTASAGGAEAEASEALYQRARLLDDLDRAADATAAYQMVAARYPAREVAGASLWRLGWLAYLHGDLRGAEERWSRLLEAPGGRMYRAGALYWKARVVEKLRGRPVAQAAYRQVFTEAPRSYYGMLAAARRGEGSVDPAIPPTVRLPADPAEAIANDPGFARVDLLRRVGLGEFAWRELEDVVVRSVGDTTRLYGFSNAYMKEERYHLGLRILRRHFAGLAASGSPALPRAFWEMLYPFGWRSEVTVAAERAGLDPYFVAAVVREESSYYPRAVSRAGARGLMQLMPGTAQPMAERRGLPFGGGELLDDPRSNLQLGTAFLAGLMRDLGDPRLALAAYNAGPKRLRQWWQARRTDDVEAFVEQIPFDETRQYVKRVMLSWDEYRRIYSGQ